MHFLAVISAIVAICVIMAQAITNYCRPYLCTKGRKHIACGNTGDFHATCPSNARMVNLTEYIDLLLCLHNEKRDSIAGGNVPGYGPAARMATMQWDEELATMAAYNVKQCKMQHDSCRNTQKFRLSGQNLAYIGYTRNESRYSDEFLIKHRFGAWFAEHVNCNMSCINRFPRNHTGKQIGHFTVIVAERNIRVGCAASRYKPDKYNYFLIACNYATTNIYDKPMYTAGISASGCLTGINPKYKNLCSTDEAYDKPVVLEKRS